jgi:hypothetical protein
VRQIAKRNDAKVRTMNYFRDGILEDAAPPASNRNNRKGTAAWDDVA